MMGRRKRENNDICRKQITVFTVGQIAGIKEESEEEKEEKEREIVCV